jgi:hypothetical protein
MLRRAIGAGYANTSIPSAIASLPFSYLTLKERGLYGTGMSASLMLGGIKYL